MGTWRLLLGVVIGVALLTYGWTAYQNQQADIENAVAVEGTVESSEVKWFGGQEGNYEAVVRYTYTYDGQEYKSRSVYPGPEKNFDLKENARAVADQFTPGETTTVYVNRERPSRAFLVEERASRIHLWALGFGALIGGGSILGLGKALLFGVSDI